ncbi:Permease of the drug/metabolite transporter (DMT) superfamily [Zunongwangia mangrovi]|uniref:Permease of the drug/metabolite transporter (DMT) superfamily n=1 Tax=Zunongwangia mangrovi TaxID=1334022 RepID=A0A1I1I7D8_9FLAO|nr:DMT family transporter [Zunongwangia mangrovi]SFC31722.1 Permease of the drug/metabolite transporter (DMT) superfamily [Zunongwangia mangrovi]
MVEERADLKHILKLNLAVIIISTSGTLGRYIELSPFLIIFLRSFIAIWALLIFCKIKGLKLNFSNKKDLLKVLFAGVLMCAHWLTYFQSLKLSSVAIGMLSIYTYPVITTFLEPLIRKTGFNKIHLFLGILVLFGVYFLVPEFSLDNQQTIAVCFGVGSAFLYSLRNILMKQQASKYNGSVLMLFQMFVVSTLLIPVLFFFDLSVIPSQLAPVLVLGLLTTSVGHTLLVSSFKYFSATTASIISSAQPIYGILLGYFILNEVPSINTVIGGLLIATAVFTEIFRSFKK